MTGEERDRDTSEAEDDRRHWWSDLPFPGRNRPDDDVAFVASPTDTMDDPGLEFFTRHAG